MSDEATHAIRERLALEGAAMSGANWFLWIAGLSAINTGLFLSGSDWMMIVGLGSTALLSWMFVDTGLLGVIVAIGATLTMGGLFAGIGLFARKRLAWAFIVGMVLYVLDGALFLLVGDYLSVAFHAYATYSIFRGFQAMRALTSPSPVTHAAIAADPVTRVPTTPAEEPIG